MGLVRSNGYGWASISWIHAIEVMSLESRMSNRVVSTDIIQNELFKKAFYMRERVEVAKIMTPQANVEHDIDT